MRIYQLYKLCQDGEVWYVAATSPEKALKAAMRAFDNPGMDPEEDLSIYPVKAPFCVEEADDGGAV